MAAALARRSSHSSGMQPKPNLPSEAFGFCVPYPLED